MAEVVMQHAKVAGIIREAVTFREKQVHCPDSKGLKKFQQGNWKQKTKLY